MRNARVWIGTIGRYWLVLVVAACSSVCGIFLAKWDRVSGIEFEIEQRLQLRFAPAKRSNQIVVIKITASDLPTTPDGAPMAIPRRTQAELVGLLKKAGAKVLVFDLIFATSQPADDIVFRRAILQSAPLCIDICQKPKAVAADDARSGYRYWFTRPALLKGELPQNIELGQGLGGGTGPETGSVLLIAKDESTGAWVENIALIAFRQLHNIPPSAVRPVFADSRLLVDTNAFQINDDGDFTIDWQRSPGGTPPFSYTEALGDLRAGDENHRFRGKIVLVGSVIGDPEVDTIVGKKFGLDMIASAENTLERTDQKKPHRLDFNDDIALGGVLALLMSLVSTLRNRTLALIFGSCVLAGGCLIPTIFLGFGIGLISTMLPVVATLAALIMGFVIRAMAPDLYPMPRSGVAEATVLIVDVMDSTPLVDSLGPAEGGRLLSDAVAVASHIVAGEGGQVIRETGDGIVAVFRARAGFDHASEAIQAAMRIVKIEGEGGFISFCAGVESGPLEELSGRLHGIPFHIASRLQALCGAEGQRLLIGPTATALARARFRCELLGERHLKGINHPVAVFKTLQQPPSPGRRSDET